MTPTDLRHLALPRYGRDWQTPLAAALGISPRTVRRYASGASPITGDMAERIRAALSDTPVVKRSRHAIQRTAERYGVVTTNADILAAELLIIARVAGNPSPAVLTHLLPREVECWIVPVAGVEMRVAYDPINARICTVLPRQSRSGRPV